MRSEVFTCWIAERFSIAVLLILPIRLQRLKCVASLFAVLGRNRQPEHRNLPLSCHIDALHVFRVGQVQGLAIFAAIDFGVRSPGFGYVATFLLEHVSHVEPALEMPAAELSLCVLLIAGTLPHFLYFYFVMGKLRRSQRGCGFASGQWSLPSFTRLAAAGIQRTSHSTRSVLPEARSWNLEVHRV